MPRNEPTGINFFCCCPDCLMFSDDFDCCFDSIPQCGEGDERMGCCIDRNTGSTIPSRDIGKKWAWEHSSGEWWKGWSVFPRYRISEGANCNDGALWEVSGNGTITTAIGFPNTGFQINFYILAPEVGTHLILHFWSSIEEPTSGFPVDIQFVEEAGQKKIRVAACDKTWVIPVSNFDGRTKFTATYTNGEFLIMSIGEMTSPDNMMLCCDVAISGGWKFSFTNASGSDEYGPIPLIVDDLTVYKEYVYPDQASSQRCLAPGFCSCDSEVTGEPRRIMPKTLTLHLHFYCPITDTHYDYYHTLTALKPTCASVSIGKSVWYSEPIHYWPSDPYPHYWSVECMSHNGFNLYKYYQTDIRGNGLTVKHCEPLRFERVSELDYVLSMFRVTACQYSGCRGEAGWCYLTDFWIEIYEE